jgi:hypothetical protein
MGGGMTEERKGDARAFLAILCDRCAATIAEDHDPHYWGEFGNYLVCKTISAAEAFPDLPEDERTGTTDVPVGACPNCKQSFRTWWLAGKT